jgi:hypothetical protein
MGWEGIGGICWEGTGMVLNILKCTGIVLHSQQVYPVQKVKNAEPEKLPAGG